MKTIKDLFNQVTSWSESIIPATTYNKKSYLSDYKSNSATFDIRYTHIYKSLILDSDVEDAIGQTLITDYASLISAFFAAMDYKYSTLYNTLNLDYNPIENYNMVESESISTSESTSESSKRSESSSHESSETGDTKNQSVSTPQVVTTVTSNQSQSDKIFGFNGSSGVDANAGSVTASDVTSMSGSDKNSMSSSETHSESSSSDSSETASANSIHAGMTGRSLTRSGNIGVTTTQEMLMSEREVALFEFYSVIFNDLMNYLTIGIFSD